MLKTLERLVVLYIRDNVYLEPLHQNQPVYRSGRLVEAALRHLIFREDRVASTRELAMRVFIYTARVTVNR